MNFYSSSFLLLTAGSNAIDLSGVKFQTPALDPMVLMKLMGAVSSCEIDIISTGMGLAAAAADPSNMDFNSIATILDKMISPVDNECSAEDEQTFRDALDDFKTCSGADLEQLMETWPSASIGELMGCGTSALKNAQAYAPFMNAMENGEELPPLPKVEFSDICIKTMYGPNPTGDFGRLLWKHPGVVCDCLGSFSKAAPDCTIEEYPIPLVGNWMRKTSCIINSAVCPMLEKICSAELNVLDQCLPPMDTGKSKYDCSAVERECLQDPSDYSAYDYSEQTMPSLLNFPQEMTGAPMPDTCQQVAGHAEFKNKNLIYRYNQHMNECVTKWEGWSDDYVSNSITTTSQLVAHVAASNKQVVKQSMGGFMGGMFMATLLFAGVAFVLYKYKNNGVPSAHGYNFMSNELI
eukprot:CAMPEP_0194130198 /NCGR_PEP_ID=MMETSP0152-20130528/1291_1 /TAXON_ID=1049557 /ORGANISM="Thalassiothrix antarctica, Strain L6-D1" /LENGTH=406 /DNA_ID=CAMNT_0038824631 /DNA_START=65 /DNA_END=1285 /DNA_ORIENTATION=+